MTAMTDQAASTGELLGTLLAPMTIRTAGQRIAERIVTAIALGEFVPDQRLPTERELASLLEVSRSTVHEALQRLQASGYVAQAIARAAHNARLAELSVQSGTLQFRRPGLVGPMRRSAQGPVAYADQAADLGY